MIQFNKTIFQFTKRLALVVILISATTQLWASGTRGSGDYAKAVVTVDPSANGKVYVDTASTPTTNPPYPNAINYSLTVQGTVFQVFSSVVATFNDITFTLYASDRTAEGYVWGGWRDADGNIISSEMVGQTTITAAGTEQKPTENTYIATWLSPKVTLATPNALPFDEIDNPTATVESKNVVFTIADYMNKNNYVTSADNSFTIEDASDDPINEEANTYTVSISYTPTGVHGSHSGTAKLSSTLNREYDDKEQTVSLTIEEDYTPIFNANYDSEANRYAFADVALGGTTESNVAFTKDNNYAASVGSIAENVKYGRALWTYTFSEFSLAGQNINKFFSIKENTGDAGAPVVVFTPGSDGTVYGFAAGAAAQQVVTAKMTMKCTYYDAANAEIVSEEKHSYLQVLVKQENTSIMRFNEGVSGDFGEVIMGEQPSIDLGMYIANVSFGDGDGCVLSGTTAGLFAVSSKPENGKVTVSISDNWEQFSGCDEHSATLTVTGTRNAPSADGANDSGQKVSVTMDLTATLILKDALVVTPSYGNGWVSFTWNKLPGAKQYDLYTRKGTSGNFTKTSITSSTNLDALESTDSQYTYTIKDLANGSASYHECYVVAMVDKDAYYEVTNEYKITPETKCIRISSVVNATPVLDWIYADNATTSGLWTGIVGTTTETDKPNAEHRQVNVSAAFNADDEALFDRLYIFGETNGTTTPLYIFSKTTKDGVSGYSLGASENEYNQVANVQSSKTGKLKIDLTSTADANISSLYFTGYCPVASTGGVNDNGAIHIIGGSKTVHIYVDDLQIYAKANTGTVTIDKSVLDDEITPNANSYYSKGKGAAFVFQSTSKTAPFNVNMHIRNSNILEGAKGAAYTIQITQSSKTLLKDSPKHYSSPICILPTGTGGSSLLVNLQLDDIWQGEHTNGKLDLQQKTNTDNSPYASIDVGNALTTLNIDGGQYSFLPVAAAYQTANYSASGEGFSLTATTYGLTGNSVSGDYTESATNLTNAAATITLNDGTFDGGTGTTIAFYATNMYIDGGSYNKEVEHYTADKTKATKLYNADNKELNRFEIINNNYWTLNGTLANITAFPNMVDDLFPDAGVNYSTTSGDQYHTALSMYYVNNMNYGHATLNPYNDKLYLMLPKLDCSSIYLPWQICAPAFELNVGGTGYNMGGGITSVQACRHHSTSQFTTDYLLFMQADSYTMGAVGSDKQYFNIAETAQYGKVVIDKKNDDPYATIAESGTYNIQKKVYMLKPIVADEWMLFTAPFDVANVYIIEPYPEAQILKDFKTRHGYIVEEEVPKAREAQAQRMMDLFAMWYFEEKGQGDPYNFFNGDGSTDINGDGTNDVYGKYVLDWIAYEQKNANNKLGVAGSNYTPEICQLVHFNGSNANQAHYFLYEQAKKWEFNSDNNFTTHWKEVAATPDAKPNSTKAIMTKGNVYAMQFPHNIIGGTHDPSKQWDYWTGKYLLIESTSKTGETIDGEANVHTISGADYKDNGLFGDGVGSGYATMRGNATFAELTELESPTTNTSLWTVEKKANQDVNVEIKNEDNTTTTTTVKRDVHEFVPMGEDASLSPAEGMIVANFQAPQGMRARSINYRTGEVTYEKIDDNNTGDIETGLPTILNGMTLIVEPTSEGLTITPIKEQHVMLFDANGKMIFSKHLSAEENVTLPTGVYVVRGEYEQVKAIKK